MRDKGTVQGEGPGNFRSVAAKGMAFIALGQAIKLLVHLTAIVVLSRLLGPSEFGVFAMISPLLALAAIVRDGGLTSAVLQRQSIADSELTALFWISLVWGIGLAALLSLLAPLIAGFYNEPRLTPLVVASSVIVIAGSLSLQHMSLLNRALRFRTLAAIDAGSLTLGYLVGGCVAMITKSYWALWAVNCTTALAIAAASWTACRWRPGRPRYGGGINDILRVGGNVTLSGLFDFLIRSVDGILIGRFRGGFELGLYSRSYRIVLLPLIFVSAPLDRLVLPSLVRMQGDRDRYRKVYRLALQAPLLAIMPSMVIIMAAPEPVCLLLLGKSWIAAAPMLAWLAIAGSLQLVTSSLNSLLISQARASELTALNAFSFVFACAAFAIGLPFGAQGVAAAYAVSEILRSPISVWWATRIGPVRTNDVARTTAPFVVSALVVFAAISWMARQLPDQPVLLLVVSVTVSYAMTVSMLLLSATGRQCLKEGVRMAVEVSAPSIDSEKNSWLRRRLATFR